LQCCYLKSCKVTERTYLHTYALEKNERKKIT
jgi:hypothetical protein